MKYYLRTLTLIINYTQPGRQVACITPWSDHFNDTNELFYKVNSCTTFPTFEAAEKALYACYPHAARHINAPSCCSYDLQNRQIH